ncbi:MAG TPA: hypothetical protein DGD08_01960 [Gemmatimonas aurantiaca]|uniref:Uncharacterized protein n=1 Tax=Gemmatimonas aurantiaca TaxID=173480 RepID=A0A3D4V4A7_9BACT|nr:hypothetical protein [Gemmatimonas aurantiaca]
MGARGDPLAPGDHLFDLSEVPAVREHGHKRFDGQPTPSTGRHLVGDGALMRLDVTPKPIPGVHDAVLDRGGAQALQARQAIAGGRHELHPRNAERRFVVHRRPDIAPERRGGRGRHPEAPEQLFVTQRGELARAQHFLQHGCHEHGDRECPARRALLRFEQLPRPLGQRIHASFE